MSYDHWPKRLYSLDVSRGLAALAVVLWHWQHFALDNSTTFQTFDSTSQPFYPVLKLFYDRGNWAVEYFFLLSGFIFFWLYFSSIAERKTSFGSFWIQRVSRLYPLHFITLVVVALLQAAYVSHNGSSFVYPYNDVYHFVLNLGFISQWSLSTDLSLSEGFSFNGPAWTVSLEIFLYLIFFAVAYSRIGILFSCLGIATISFIVLQQTHGTYNSIFLGTAFFFLGGVVFQTTAFISTKSRKLRTTVYIASILLWILVVVNHHFYDFESALINHTSLGVFLVKVLTLTLSPLTVCSLTLFEIQYPGFLKPVAWIGDITYSCYLLHFPLQLVFVLAASYGYLNNEFYLNPSYLILFFSLLIPFSYASYVRLERPLQKILKERLSAYFNQKKRSVTYR